MARDADFSSADLSHAILVDTDFEGATLEGALLIGADARSMNLNHAQLHGADFTDAHLQGADMRESLLGVGFVFTHDVEDQLEAPQRTNFTNANLRGATLGRVDSDECLVSQVCAPTCFFGRSTLGCFTHFVNMYQANVLGADLSGVEHLGRMIFNQTLVDSETRFPADTDPVLAEAFLDYHFIGPGTTISNGILRDKDLSFVDLTGADLSKVDLIGADLTGATLAGVTFTNSVYDERTTWPDHFTPELGLYNLGPGGDLFNVDFSGMDLSGLDLSTYHGSDYIDNTMITLVNFANTRFIGTIFRGAVFESVSFQNADLSNADFRGASFTDCNFVDADTQGTRFEDSSFSNTICPDGTNSNDNNNSCSRER